MEEGNNFTRACAVELRTAELLFDTNVSTAMSAAVTLQTKLFDYNAMPSMEALRSSLAGDDTVINISSIYGLAVRFRIHEQTINILTDTFPVSGGRINGISAGGILDSRPRRCRRCAGVRAVRCFALR
jgi:hypothetical protein